MVLVTPETETPVPLANPTVIFGVPANPPAVPETLPVTLPVRSPITPPVAVVTPETTIVAGVKLLGVVPVTVTAAPEIALTDKLSPKSIVPAVPTKLPPSLITIPVPDAVTPVSPAPSPTNLAAVIVDDADTTATLILGVPVNPLATVAVAALPVQDPEDPEVLPVTLPVTLPTNVVAVTIPVNLPSPDTVKALVEVVVPIPTLDVVFIPVAFFWK